MNQRRITPDQARTYKEYNDLQNMLDVVHALMYADWEALRSLGVIKRKPVIDRDAALRYEIRCEERGVCPRQCKQYSPMVWASYRRRV